MLAATSMFLIAVASVACSSKVSQALEYDIGTPVGVMLTELGAPDADRPLSEELRQIGFCPPGTTRLVEYHRKPLMPWIDEGAEAVVCVDGNARIVAILSSSPW